ncbi:MAG: MarR family winged helix-turn-helix transcriptional regulator [Steroidobacteraceae bacterium]
MTSLCCQIQEMEIGLSRLQRQIPDLPFTQILTSRLLVHLGRELSNKLDQRLRPHGLSEMEFRTLMNVYSFRDTAAYPSELCSSLAQSPANITRITDTLVERGLISRVPDAQDRRRLLLKTTEEGERLVQDMFPLMMNSVHASYRDFSSEDLHQLLNSLKRLAQAIDEADLKAAAQPES